MLPHRHAAHKEGRKLLDEVFAKAEHCWIIHYSCESFYDRPDGRTARVTSIAVRNLRSGQTHSFSIHKVAELAGITGSHVSEAYDTHEKKMLKVSCPALFGSCIPTKMDRKSRSLRLRPASASRFTVSKGLEGSANRRVELGHEAASSRTGCGVSRSRRMRRVRPPRRRSAPRPTNRG